MMDGWTLSVTCDKCKKQVDSIEWSHDIKGMAYRFVAKCHGEKDTCNVPETFFQQPTGIYKATAFSQPIKLVVKPSDKTYGAIGD